MDGLIVTVVENNDCPARESGLLAIQLEPVFHSGMVFSKEEVRIGGRTVQARWLKYRGKFIMRVSVPQDTRCTLKLPDGRLLPFGQGEHRVECALHRSSLACVE